MADNKEAEFSQSFSLFEKLKNNHIGRYVVFELDSELILNT